MVFIFLLSLHAIIITATMSVKSFRLSLAPERIVKELPLMSGSCDMLPRLVQPGQLHGCLDIPIGLLQVIPVYRTYRDFGSALGIQEGPH